MKESILLSIATILTFGISSQWLALRLKQPTILFLLLSGFLAGPVLGILNTDQLLGNLLSPIISVFVGLILFEGGLNLKLDELKHAYRPLKGLLTIGVLLNWLLISLFAFWLFKVNLQLAILIGAILIVTGPTVIIPLLSHIRPTSQVQSILKWEGILIDPIGATLALIVMEVILASKLKEAMLVIVLSVIKTIVGAFFIGLLAAALLVFLLRKRLLPDPLKQSAVLALIVMVFAISENWQAESGLLATTLMGIVLANQPFISIRDIHQFSGNLQILLLSALFILLAARLEPLYFANLDFRVILFVALVILVARPVSVWAATRNTTLANREKLFLSCMAPRGIVAAAVASIGALRLIEHGYQQAQILVPVTFSVIIATILVYGIFSKPLAKSIQLTKSEPQGLMILGAHYFARQMAKVLLELGFDVIVVDTARHNILQASDEGIPCRYVSALSDFTLKKVEEGDILNMIALTSNDELNTLATLRYTEILGSTHVYQLAPMATLHQQADNISPDLYGRILFRTDVTYDFLNDRFMQGAEIETIVPQTEAEVERFSEAENVIPLFALKEAGKLHIINAEQSYAWKLSEPVICLSFPR